MELSTKFLLAADRQPRVFPLVWITHLLASYFFLQSLSRQSYLLRQSPPEFGLVRSAGLGG